MAITDDDVIAGGALALLLLGSSSSSSSSPPLFVQWPLPTLRVGGEGPDGQVTRDVRAYEAAVSDGYHPDGHPRLHRGADIMFRRSRKWSTARRLVTGVLMRRWDERHFSNDPPNGSPGGWYFCPPRTPIRPVAPGRLWHASMGDAGGQVVIDHGTWVSLYLHLEALNVPLARNGVVVGAKQNVGLSTVLGHVGADPRQGRAGIRHLHLEAWGYRGTGRGEGRSERVYYDPEPLLRAARRWSLDVSEGSSTLEPP